MQLEQFLQSIQNDEQPPSMSVYLKALWYDGKNQWQKAHAFVDQLQDPTACWVHAYLHRKEGDLGNAEYWYRRAGKQRPDLSLPDEWTKIVEALL